jgi:tRNA threonylcarbamoyladenosine biosynthesis protein TsaE
MREDSPGAVRRDAVDTFLYDVLPIRAVSVGETRSLGRQLADLLTDGDVVALYGDLGSGKTEFVRGVCTGLGIAEGAVRSPSFTLVNEYSGGRLNVFHVDAYRLSGPEEFADIGFEEYLGGDGVCLIEWAERIEALLPPASIRLLFKHWRGESRLISPKQSPGER